MAQILLIGAGLTGLSTAYHLEKNGFFDFAIFEKEDVPGGLCRSMRQDGFTFDYTGHLLHANNNYMEQFLQTVQTRLPLTQAARNSFIYSHDTLTPYPYQQNLYGLPPNVIADCIEGFIERKKIKNPQTFTAWVNTHFGAGFGAQFFFPYQEKLFAYDYKKLSASWTGRFVPKTTIRDLILGALSPAQKELVGYNAHFLYPESGGIDQLIKTMTRLIATPIQTNHTAQEIDTSRKTVTFANGRTEFYETLISTMPLDTTLGMLKNTCSANRYTPAYAHQSNRKNNSPLLTKNTIQDAQHNLRCNRVININLGIARPILQKAHWIYYPEKKHLFYRIGLPHQLSPAMAPANHSSLSIEVSQYEKKSPGIPPESVIENALSQAKKLFQIDNTEIVYSNTTLLPHAYVIYDRWRDKHLAPLLKQLATHEIHSIGRYGGWKYSSMQEAILDGKQMAEKICAEKKNISCKQQEIKKEHEKTKKAGRKQKLS